MRSTFARFISKPNEVLEEYYKNILVACSVVVMTLTLVVLTSTNQTPGNLLAGIIALVIVAIGTVAMIWDDFLFGALLAIGYTLAHPVLVGIAVSGVIAAVIFLVWGINALFIAVILLLFAFFFQLNYAHTKYKQQGRYHRN